MVFCENGGVKWRRASVGKAVAIRIACSQKKIVKFSASSSELNEGSNRAL